MSLVERFANYAALGWLFLLWPSVDAYLRGQVRGLQGAVLAMALTVYTATLARRAEYGVLKALGAHNRQLYGVVLTQALISVGRSLRGSASSVRASRS